MKKKKISTTKRVAALKVSDEFVVGKRGIGWINSRFVETYGAETFDMGTLGRYQVLPRTMSDEAIESELKPGICTPSDLVAFLDGAPQECKDGKWNIFYFSGFVVSVGWRSRVGGWSVNVWCRDNVWDGGPRVFSPGAGALTLGPKSSDTLTLELAIKMVKKEGYRIFKEF